MDIVLAASSYVGLFYKILTVAIGLGLVIFFHELGHFAVAKWCNVLVERFSIGFGPILWRKKWGETEYALSAVPFGGYVKMLGQDDIDPGQMTDDQVAADPRSYSSKTVLQRMAIISAGVTMNVITGLMFYALAFRSGVDVLEPQVGTVRPGMSAWKNGIRTGDTITSMNGRPIDEFYDILRQTALSRGDVSVVGKHADGTTFDATFTPDRNEFRRMIGVGWEQSLNVPRLRDPEIPISDPGSPAAKSDFQPGDQIVEVGGRAVKTHQEMLNALSEQRDQAVTFVVNRPGQDGKSSSRADVTVEPQPFRDLGIRMQIGKITAVRGQSPAHAAGITEGDFLIDVDGQDVGKDLDPMRLPDYFSAKAGQEVTVKVKRETRKAEPTVLTMTTTPEPRLPWSEPPEMPERSVLSIPSLGIAFEVRPVVLSVDPEGPASKLGLEPGDSIVKLTLPKPTPTSPEPRKLDVSEVKEGEPYSSWPFAFWLIQNQPAAAKVTLTVRSPGTDLLRDIEIEPVAEAGWNMPTTRGLNLAALTMEKKAGSISEACAMSLDHTRNSVLDIYLTLRNLVVGDLSVKSLHGPIGIAKTAAIIAEEGLPDFLLFLGLISINLAVINFLPIPVLDGGHMVFLLWEGLTRRRPSERVVVAATYVGLAFVASLMVAVIYIDLFVVKK